MASDPSIILYAWERIAEPYAVVAIGSLARAFPIVAMLPLIGANLSSPIVRTGLAVVVALLTAPQVGMDATNVGAMNLIAMELLYGIAVGLTIRLLWELGVLTIGLAEAGIGRGSFGSGGFTSNQGDGPLTNLASIAFLAMFASSGAYASGLLQIASSSAFSMTEGQAIETLVLLLHLFAQAVAIAVPVFAAALLVDLTLGWANRTLSSLPAMFIAMPLRSAVGWMLIPALLIAAFYSLEASYVELGEILGIAEAP